MKRVRNIGFIVAAFVGLCGVVFALPVPSVSAASSSSLSIEPRKNYVIEPGQTVPDKLTIQNLDPSAPLNLSLRVIDFTFTDNGGTPKLFLAENAPETTWSLKRYLTVPKTVSIPPHSSKTVDMGVSIPAGHGAGSYYSAIIYSSGTPNGGNVGLSASGVTLVFVSIPGQVSENLQLKQFGAYVPAATADTQGNFVSVTSRQPDTMAYTLKNSGNVTEAPAGTITLKDLFGRKTVIGDVNPNQSLALIGQTRTYTACIKLKAQPVASDGDQSKSIVCDTPGLWPGRYSAALDIFYGQNGNQTQEITKTAVFWYLPLWFIAVVVIILGLITYFVWRVVRVVRRKLYGPTRSKTSARRR